MCVCVCVCVHVSARVCAGDSARARAQVRLCERDWTYYGFMVYGVWCMV
jgi:ATP/maltotriose-dependent transcriptional regulator MalT